MNTPDIIETKNRHGETVWIIRLADGSPHPVEFISHSMALAHMGLLRSRGFQEGQRA